MWKNVASVKKPYLLNFNRSNFKRKLQNKGYQIKIKSQMLRNHNKILKLLKMKQNRKMKTLRFFKPKMLKTSKVRKFLHKLKKLMQGIINRILKLKILLIKKTKEWSNRQSKMFVLILQAVLTRIKTVAMEINLAKIISLNLNRLTANATRKFSVWIRLILTLRIKKNRHREFLPAQMRL